MYTTYTVHSDLKMEISAISAIPRVQKGKIILKFLPFCQLNEEYQEWKNLKL